MDNINDLKKSLDDVEQVFITKAVKDKKDIAEAKKAIVKQLDTLILKAETELLEKHFVTPGFISKPAAKVKSIASGVGRVGAATGKTIASGAKKVADVYNAPKITGQKHWESLAPKAPTSSVHSGGTITKPDEGAFGYDPSGTEYKPKKATSAAPSVTTTAPKKTKTSNIAVKTKTPSTTKPSVEKPTGIPHDFGGTTTPTKISKPPESGTSKLMEQANKLERQLTQPKPAAKKITPKPVVKPVESKPAPVVEASKLTPFQEATKKINNIVAAKRATTTQAPAPKQQQTKPVVPFKNIPETPKVNVPTGEIDTKLKTIKEGKSPEPSGITAGSGDATAQELKKVTTGRSKAL